MKYSIRLMMVLLCGCMSVLAKAQVTDSLSGKKEQEVFMVVEKMPEFPGGETALNDYLAKNIHYPDSAGRLGISGKVYLTFIVDTDGSVTDVEISRGIGGGCDEEALRLMKNMPKWAPGTMNGKPVRVRFMLPVRFEPAR